MKNAVRFREKLARHEPCIGVGITFCDPTVTDALSGVFDFVWIDMEHNALTLESVQAHIMAAQINDATAIVRIPSHDATLVKTVLDVGADGIIAPNVRTPDETRHFVSACRYPPEGIRGYGPRRPSGYGRIGGPDYCKAANQAVLAIAQIEHIDAVQKIDEILAVQGLDSVVFGPNDLSGSMGHMAEPKHPEVLRAMEKVISKALGTKVAVGSGAGDPNDAEYWIRQGVQWVLAAGDTSLMMKAANETAAAVHRIWADHARIA
jgi:2-keto-3-deoxy-L-rhamnonate aldolase RhmA